MSIEIENISFYATFPGYFIPGAAGRVKSSFYDLVLRISQEELMWAQYKPEISTMVYSSDKQNQPGETL